MAGESCPDRRSVLLLHAHVLLVVEGLALAFCERRREPLSLHPTWMQRQNTLVDAQEAVGTSVMRRLDRTHTLLFPRQTACRLDHRRFGEERPGQASLVVRRCRNPKPMLLALLGGRGVARSVVVLCVGNRFGCLGESSKSWPPLQGVLLDSRSGRRLSRDAVVSGANSQAGARGAQRAWSLPVQPSHSRVLQVHCSNRVACPRGLGIRVSAKHA